jgi:hypothetical protein
MKIPAVVAMWMCAAFALVAYGAAYTAFSGLQTLTDTAERDIASGYGWFWAFLGVVATAFGVLSWLMKEGKLGQEE